MQNLAATSPASSPSIHHHRRASSMRFAPRAAAVRYVPPPPPPSAPSGGTQGPAADNGFNFLSRADGHHLFDGGAAETYACRLTGRIHGHSGIARLLDPSRGHGAVVVHAGRLVAMMSGDDLRRHQVRVADDFF
ncbi:hypothetical protein HU200_008794 [Digitaria exilis]|uniref:Uncharacterized protein n=1 Tax=Digitaria exilis TaxID=1010633 RepID=A0A835FLR3_9POAL|nr:hypothetical protein HU200_008794 [Digitaria exilis]